MGSKASTLTDALQAEVKELDAALTEALAVEVEEAPINTCPIGILTTSLHAEPGPSYTYSGTWSEMGEDDDYRGKVTYDDNDVVVVVKSPPEERWSHWSCSVLVTFLVERLTRDTSLEMSERLKAIFVEALMVLVWHNFHNWTVSVKSKDCMLRIAKAVYLEMLTAIDRKEFLLTSMLDSIRRHMERAKSPKNPKYGCKKSTTEPTKPLAPAKKAVEEQASLKDPVTEYGDHVQCAPVEKWDRLSCLVLVTFEVRKLVELSPVKMSEEDMADIINSVTQKLWDSLPNWETTAKSKDSMFRIAMAVHKDVSKKHPKDPDFTTSIIQSYKQQMEKDVPRAQKPSILKRLCNVIVKPFICCCCPTVPED